MLKKTLVAALLATALSTMVAVAQAEVSFVRGDTGNPGTLDPHRGSLIEEVFILQDLVEGLLALNEKGELVPGVAERWEMSEDGLRYTFHLRPDAKWSNGEPVTADDFVYSFRRFFSPEIGGRLTNYFSAIRNAPEIVRGEKKPEELGIVATDAHMLTIELTQPLAYLPDNMTYVFLGPVNRKNVEEFGDRFTAPGNLVTNGAYVLESNTPNESIVLRKNPHFHDAANVQIDKVTYIPFEDSDNCVRRFEAGEVQACAAGSKSAVPAESLEAIQQRFGDQVVVGPRLFSLYAHFNLNKEKLKDARVRQALSMAVDREFLADSVFQGLADPSYGMIPSTIANYDGGTARPDWADQPIIDREDRAIALMEEAGYGPGKPLQLEFAYWIQAPGGRDLAAAIAEMWKPLGVEVTFNPRDAAAHFQHLSTSDDYEVALAGLISIAISDPSYHSAILTSASTFNYANYKNPEYDDLVAQANRETDPVKRGELFRQAENILLRDVPTLTVAYPRSAELVSEKVSGWTANVLGSHPTRYLRLAE